MIGPKHHADVLLAEVSNNNLVVLRKAFLLLAATLVSLMQFVPLLPIEFQRYAPAVFRGNRLLALLAGGELIDHLTVQESIAA
jgi:hypothetical protein